MRRLRWVCLIAALGSNLAYAGVFDDEEARRKIADLQIKTEARFDQQGRGQLELANQIQRQVEEIARLRGQVESLTYEIEQAKKRQQDFYLDLDSRLRKLESPAEGNAAVDPAQAAKTPAVDPAKESLAYDAALDLFKAQKYKEAAAAFAALVEQNPSGTLAPNAQYWLGNAWFAQRNCNKAIEAQTVVTTRYASSDKAPDAWLTIASCQQELGNQAAAKKTLQTLIEKYPAAPAADKARDRLKKK